MSQEIDMNEKIEYGFGGNFMDLICEVSTAELNYMKAKQDYESSEASLWLYTNWDEAFDGKKPTQKDKEFWIKKQLLPLKETLNVAELRMKDVRRIYDVAYKYSLEVVR